MPFTEINKGLRQLSQKQGIYETLEYDIYEEDLAVLPPDGKHFISEFFSFIFLYPTQGTKKDKLF